MPDFTNRFGSAKDFDNRPSNQRIEPTKVDPPKKDPPNLDHSNNYRKLSENRFQDEKTGKVYDGWGNEIKE